MHYANNRCQPLYQSFSSLTPCTHLSTFPQVMGLAPWAPMWQSHLEPPTAPPATSLLVGSALEGTLAVDWDAISDLESSAPLAGWRDAAAADATAYAALGSSATGTASAHRGGGGPQTAAYANMAASAQSSLEAHALPLLQALRAQTNATNLCIAGGTFKLYGCNLRILSDVIYVGDLSKHACHNTHLLY